MTLKEYKSKLIMRRIPGYPGYCITNTGKIYSEKTQAYIKPTTSGANKSPSYYVSINGKLTYLNNYKIMLSVFKDLEISSYILSKFSRKNRGIKGVYSADGYCKTNKYRVIIQKNKKSYFFGYFKNKIMAEQAAIQGYLILNNII